MLRMQNVSYKYIDFFLVMYNLDLDLNKEPEQ